MDGTRKQAGDGLIHRLSLVGEMEGEVRRLDAFEKSRHTAPKFASDRAQQFLQRLVNAELIEWGEALFSSMRESMDYRRKDVALMIEGGAARIESKDFLLERRYSLISDRPERYLMETELMRLSSVDLLELDAFNQAIGPHFDRLKCVFNKKVSVENIIDGIEDLAGSELAVSYPSTCDFCDVRKKGLDVVFRFDPAILEIRFSSSKLPRQLWESYQTLSEAMASDNRTSEWLTCL